MLRAEVLTRPDRSAARQHGACLRWRASPEPQAAIAWSRPARLHATYRCDRANPDNRARRRWQSKPATRPWAHTPVLNTKAPDGPGLLIVRLKPSDILSGLKAEGSQEQPPYR